MRRQDGTFTYTPRTAAQVKSDTGLPAYRLVMHGVQVATHRWGATDRDSLAHTYDIAMPVAQRALNTLVAKGEVARTIDPETGDTVYSVAR